MNRLGRRSSVRYLTMVLCAMAMASVPLWAADDADAQAEASTISVVPDEQAGVFSSLKLQEGSDIREFLKVLGDYWHRNIVTSKSVTGPVSINLYDVTYREALDAVLNANGFVYEEDGPFIFVYTAKEYEDRLAAARTMESRVFTLNYITPEQVSELIKTLLSEGSTTAQSPAAGDAAGEAWAGNNCIVIRDYPEVLNEIASLVEAMDHRPTQVLVEATILSARLTDINSLGIDFNVLAGADFEAVEGVVSPLPDAATGEGAVVSGTGISAAFGAGGLSIGLVNNNIGLFIDALESITDTVMLGNPKVLTLNRQEGQVKVGGEQGYLTTESTATSTTQTVETLSTGIILRFRPFVMDDGYIRLELHPEDSTGEVVVKGDFALPEKTTAEVSTNVLVKDGHTIVIGGLFRDTTTTTRSQVPFVGNIPVVGNLFRSTNDDVRKEELIFLITPRIIENVEYAAASEKLLLEADERVAGIRDGLMGTGREKMAAMHYHLAKEHQAAGRLDKALWDAQLAALMSPTFFDAVRLHNELRTDQIHRGEFGSMGRFMREILDKDVRQSSIDSTMPTSDFAWDSIEIVEPTADTSTVDFAMCPADPMTSEDTVVVCNEVNVVADGAVLVGSMADDQVAFDLPVYDESDVVSLDDESIAAIEVAVGGDVFGDSDVASDVDAELMLSLDETTAPAVK